MAKVMKKLTGQAKLVNEGLTPEECKPTLYIDFNDPEEADEFKEEALGTTVTVVLQGKLRSFSHRKDKYGGSASISLESFKVEKIENNLFAELADD